MKKKYFVKTALPILFVCAALVRANAQSAESRKVDSGVPFSEIPTIAGYHHGETVVYANGTVMHYMHGSVDKNKYRPSSNGRHTVVVPPREPDKTPSLWDNAASSTKRCIGETAPFMAAAGSFVGSVAGGAAGGIAASPTVVGIGVGVVGGAAAGAAVGAVAGGALTSMVCGVYHYVDAATAHLK